MVENIHLAFEGIWSHKLRSVLTMLGIIIGIAAIITIVSTIKGTNEQIKENLIGAGNNWNQHKKAVNLMADGQVNIEHFATNLIKIEEYEKGLELARKRPEGFVKAVFTYE